MASAVFLMLNYLLLRKFLVERAPWTPSPASSSLLQDAIFVFDGFANWDQEVRIKRNSEHSLLHIRGDVTTICPGHQLEASSKQHETLCRRLKAKKVSVHTILLGVGGSIHASNT